MTQTLFFQKKQILLCILFSLIIGSSYSTEASEDLSIICPMNAIQSCLTNIEQIENKEKIVTFLNGHYRLLKEYRGFIRFHPFDESDQFGTSGQFIEDENHKVITKLLYYDIAISIKNQNNTRAIAQLKNALRIDQHLIYHSLNRDQLQKALIIYDEYIDVIEYLLTTQPFEVIALIPELFRLEPSKIVALTMDSTEQKQVIQLNKRVERVRQELKKVSADAERP